MHPTAIFHTGSILIPYKVAIANDTASLSPYELWSYLQSPSSIFSLWRTHNIKFWIVVILSPIGEAGSRLINGDQSNERGHKTQVLRSTLKQCNNLEPSTSWPKINHEFQDDLTKRNVVAFFFPPLAKLMHFHRKYQFCSNHKCLSNHFNGRVSNQC